MLRRAWLLTLSVVVLTACAAGQTSGSNPLVIGAVYPLSGPQADGGKQELGGLEAALQVGRDRGVISRQVTLKIEDVQTPAGARAAVDRLIDQDHVPIIAGTYGSTLAEAAAAEADRRHTIYWESGAVADLVTQHREYVFRTVATGMTLGDTAVRFTHDVLLPRSDLQPGGSRAVIVSVDDVYGRSVGDGEEAMARQLGVQVVDRIRYDAAAYDPAAIAARVAADQPHFLWDVSYLDDGIAIWQAVKASGVRLQAAVGTSSAFCMPGFGERLGEQALGVYAADKPDDQVSPAALTPAARSMLATAKKNYAALGLGSQMPIPAVAGFVAGWTLFHAVLPHVSGNVTPDSVRDAAYRVDEPAGSSINGGGVRFAPAGAPNAGQNVRAPSVVGQWQTGGMVRAVWPPRFATSEPS